MFDRRFFANLIISIGVSCLLIAVLLEGFSGSTDPAQRPRLLQVITAASMVAVGAYLLSAIIQAFFRALRYRVILGVSEKELPSLLHIVLVTVSRNMFVDMLPARLGELSFVAMLNRGYKVSADACLSALAISFVFDLVALAILLLALMVYGLAVGGFQPWLAGTVVMICLVCAVFYALLFSVFSRVMSWLHRYTTQKTGWLTMVVSLGRKTALTLEKARTAGIVGRVLLLSLCVRCAKYLGLYLLFVAVVVPSFPEVTTVLSSVLVTLISGEAGAAMPVPTFMSFGSYEAGGALTLATLGVEKASSVIIMLSVHIWSQLIDYSLGIAALVLFIFYVGKKTGAGRQKQRRWQWLPLVAGVGMLLLGVLFVGLQVRKVKKMGALVPPDPGRIMQTQNGVRPVDPRLAEMKGFLVWSSNRYGNHDIIMLTLPEQKEVRLTSHPHTEYFPRISPDGARIVFCRSREPWISQRNELAWDVYLLNPATGQEQLIAEYGNVPTWSKDGNKIYFQRQGNQFVEYNLVTQKETVVFETGKNLDLPSSVTLQTPEWSNRRNALAVTLRGSKRGTVTVEQNGTIGYINGGCQLNWSNDSSYLFYVNHGGNGGNAIYRVVPETMQSTLWFDAPGEYSHEYFPKVSNTGDVLVYGASTGGHEHDTADYEIFLWQIGSAADETIRISFYSGNDCWPDIFLNHSMQE